VGATRESSRAALARDDLGVEARVLGSFECIHRLGVGSAAPEYMSELLEAAVTLMGPVMADLEKGLVSDLTRVLASTGVSAAWKDAGLGARELAEHLFATSLGLKQRVATAGEYLERMRVAVKIVCRRRSERRPAR
jgi:hypothetical protein